VTLSPIASQPTWAEISNCIPSTSTLLPLWSHQALSPYLEPKNRFRQAGNRFLGPLKGLKTRALYTALYPSFPYVISFECFLIPSSPQGCTVAALLNHSFDLFDYMYSINHSISLHTPSHLSVSLRDLLSLLHDYKRRQKHLLFPSIPSSAYNAYDSLGYQSQGGVSSDQYNWLGC
jgi:hypothetical protein